MFGIRIYNDLALFTILLFPNRLLPRFRIITSVIVISYPLFNSVFTFCLSNIENSEAIICVIILLTREGYINPIYIGALI